MPCALTSYNKRLTIRRPTIRRLTIRRPTLRRLTIRRPTGRPTIRRLAIVRRLTIRRPTIRRLKIRRLTIPRGWHWRMLCTSIFVRGQNLDRKFFYCCIASIQ